MQILFCKETSCEELRSKSQTFHSGAGGDKNKVNKISAGNTRVGRVLINNPFLFMSVFFMNYYCNLVSWGYKTSHVHRVPFSDRDSF